MGSFVAFVKLKHWNVGCRLNYIATDLEIEGISIEIAFAGHFTTEVDQYLKCINEYEQIGRHLKELIELNIVYSKDFNQP